ncbi:hypothetical protein DXG01_006552 [Tephrocybe rancida]|nr:hypothetical protein DXG01_006552 [Tephrocybe rancida]
MERLECLFRKQVNDHKVDAHTVSSIKQCEPAITKVVQSFNALCNTMEDLLKKGKAPLGVTCPKKLEIKGIFALDVDDSIWEDLGLDEGSPAAPPPWLSGKGVHMGIRALLEYDRCVEEKLSVNLLDFGNFASLPAWGPSAEEIINFRIVQNTAVFKEAPTINTESRDTESNIKSECWEQDEESKYSDSEHGEADIILFDILDSADASWTGADDKHAKAAMSFISSGRYVKLALVSPKKLSALLLIANGDRKLLQVGKEFAICITAIRVAACHLITTPTRKEALMVPKYISGNPHSYDFTRLSAVLCMAFHEWELHAQLSLDELSFKTKTNPVPIYDARGVPVDYQKDLPFLVNRLPPFSEGEVPNDSFAVVGYSASTYKDKKSRINLSLNVLFMIVVGTP